MFLQDINISTIKVSNCQYSKIFQLTFSPEWPYFHPKNPRRFQGFPEIQQGQPETCENRLQLLAGVVPQDALHVYRAAVALVATPTICRLHLKS